MTENGIYNLKRMPVGRQVRCRCADVRLGDMSMAMRRKKVASLVVGSRIGVSSSSSLIHRHNKITFR